jgi:short-subunit dehydrogenase
MTALITGATAGIGQAFAEVLAEEGTDLVLVARSAERLAALADRLSSRHAIAAEVLVADLSTDEGSRTVMRRVGNPAAAVDLLVNNAGFGVNQSFVGGDLSQEEAMLDVLVRATLRLSHAALPGMVDRGSGVVINVSSVAGWLPAGTYSAAKSWVTVFTEGLSAELAGTGVTATAVCPGLTRTEFHDRADMELGSLPGFAWLEARRVAVEGLRDARAGRVISVPSKRYSGVSLVAQHTPRPILRRLGSMNPTRRRGR